MFSTIFVSIHANSSNYLKILIFQINKYLNQEKTIVIFFFFVSSHFMERKVQYLQPLTKTLVEFMGNITCVYYQCSLSIAKLLPPDVCNEELFTKFESDSFEISDEIDYQALKVNNTTINFQIHICL